MADIEARDRGDTERSVAPVRPAADAVTVDTTGLGIQEVFALLLAEVKDRGMI